jgi:thiol:disulfide interchange protein DsbA
MRFFQRALATVVLGLAAAAAGASPASPVAGAEYRVLDQPQQTDSGNKVEVTEFFWYACPHCYAFEPDLAKWVAAQGDKIVFKRIPVVFRESFIPQQKMYYALEAMGKLGVMHKKVFDAIHVDRKRLETDSAILEFVESQGIDKAKFLDAYNSFAVQTKVSRVPKLQQAYRIDSVPMVTIDGRFVTAPSILGETKDLNGKSERELHAATLEVMSALVADVAKNKGGAKPAAKPAKAKTAGAAAGAK